MQGLYGIYFAFVNTITYSVAAHVFDFPAILTARRSLACQHLSTIVFLLISVVQQLGVAANLIDIHQMGRRVMAACGHA
jgi:hypothetical protein